MTSFFKRYIDEFTAERASTSATAQQLPFAVTFAIAVAAIAVFRTHTFLEIEFVAGVVIVVAVTILAFVITWPRAATVIMIVPVADFLAIALCSDAAASEGLSLAILCFLPGLWLAILFRGKGAWLATALTMVALIVPDVIRLSPSDDAFVFVRHGLVCLVILAVCGVVVVMRRQLTIGRRHRREALAQSRASKNLLQAIVDSVDVGILAMDNDGNDMIFNRAQREIHAVVSPPENTDKTEAGHLIYDLDGETPLPVGDRAAARALRGESYSGMTMLIGPGTERERALSASARPLTGPDGEHIGTVVAFYDVTELVRTVQAGERFVLMVSHELRTPITSIIGYLDLLVDEAGGTNQAIDEYLAVINRGAERVLSLVDDLLLGARLDNGKLQLNPVPTDVAALIASSAESAEPRAASKNIEIVRRLEPMRPVAVDGARLSQVIDNLLSNAIKYTPAGGRITLSAKTNANNLIIEVADTGIGMTAEETANIFTAFYRAEAAVQRRIDGTGLGLVVSKEIVEQHGGFIAVSSTAGVGSAFRVTIPQLERP
ncbi:sensor histidine kinase [Spelaeicoccus albus]|uniref:histidine kinase n=1 Tax=Spelaeicoccus albus TaxID=1280376 RepID=A0A7Z0D2B6_9MICO|nr:ATP-binding protein [Spelaeicoccus albus]NYI67571.1 signal transduction histidine kinase [Spelaeicoccus albus]